MTENDKKDKNSIGFGPISATIVILLACFLLSITVAVIVDQLSTGYMYENFRIIVFNMTITLGTIITAFYFLIRSGFENVIEAINKKEIS